jgi:hypothetical protein
MHMKIKYGIISLLVLLLIPLVSINVFASAIQEHCADKGGDGCIRQLALERNDIDICDEVTADDARGSCYAAFAVKHNDLNLCRKESKKDKRNDCYLKFVKGYDDLNICTGKIKGDKGQDECFDEIRDDYDEPDLCTYFHSETKRIKCFKRAAKKADDESICDMITPTDEEVKCSSRYGSACGRGGSLETAVLECKRQLNIGDIKEGCDNAEYTLEQEVLVDRHHSLKLGTQDVAVRISNMRSWEKTAIVNVDGIAQAMKYGDVMKSGSVSLLFLDIIQKEEEGRTRKYVSICLYKGKEASAPVKQEEEKEEVQVEEKAIIQDTPAVQKAKEEARKKKEAEELLKQKQKEAEEKRLAEEAEKQDKKDAKKKEKKEGGIFKKLLGWMFFWM